MGNSSLKQLHVGILLLAIFVVYCANGGNALESRMGYEVRLDMLLVSIS